MSRRNTILLKAALSALHYSGVGRLASSAASARGVIFMLHHVRPEEPRSFEPNRILSITPEFLDCVIRKVVAAGYEPISLDEVPSRLAKTANSRPFACFTFDDGYRDNRDHALPVFKSYNVPLAIFVPSQFASGEGELWWLTLEEVLRRKEWIAAAVGGKERQFSLLTAGEKSRAFHEIYWWLRGLDEREARQIVTGWAASAGLTSTAFCKDLVMDWNELREVAREPLVTIGAHTREHYALAKLSHNEARAEIRESVRQIESELGRPCRHFSFPYGDEGSAGAREFEICAELGLSTAVTTRKGLIRARHSTALTALPRLSLNGDYQDERYLDVLLSGVPFAMNDAIGRVLGRKAA